MECPADGVFDVVTLWSVQLMELLMLLQGVGPQEYTLIKMKVKEPFPDKLR